MVSVKKRLLISLFEDVQRAIAVDQPKLKAKLETNGVSISGTYILKPVTNEHIGWGPMAEYQVYILFPSTFPKKYPIVCETGGTIPRNEDYHINSDGTCCIGVPETWGITAKKDPIQYYFDVPFRNFFLSQHQKALTDEWPFDVEKHGKEGIINAFAELLSCKEDEKKIRSLLRMLSKGKIKGKWLCYCDSGRIIKECCIAQLIELGKEVSQQDAKRMLLRLNSCN